MKIEIEPEVALAFIQHLESRQDKEIEKVREIFSAAAPVLAQLFAKSGHSYDSDDLGDHAH